MANPTALITIKSDHFDPNILVTVSPQPIGEALDRQFDYYPQAKRYADQLADSEAWLLIDLVGAQMEAHIMDCC